MKLNEILKLNLSKEDILLAIAKSKMQDFHDNLRKREKIIQFDSKLRGYIGEIALKKWFSNNGIEVEATNYFDEESGMDIDFEYKGLQMELKTSLIPDSDSTMKNVIKNRDIKIIRRTRKIEDLRGDIHIQIFYDQLTNKKDEWLTEQKIEIDSKDLEYIYDNFLGKSYINKTYLVAWIDKPTLSKQMSDLKGYEKSWRFDKRRFWVCKLTNCFPPNELINYLNKIKTPL